MLLISLHLHTWQVPINPKETRASNVVMLARANLVGHRSIDLVIDPLILPDE